MQAYWEWKVLAFLISTAGLYRVLYRVLLWMENRKFTVTRHETPIYGSPDPYRVMGQDARANVRLK